MKTYKEDRLKLLFENLKKEKRGGLGIFIAQSLLERSGAALSFRNRGGGEVAISWPRGMLELASNKPKMGFKELEEH